MTSSVCLLGAKTKLRHCEHTHPSCWSSGCCKVVKLCAICADVYAFGTPAAGASPGYGHMLISTHGGGHMPMGMSPGYVMTTPDFCLPMLTPLPSTSLSQHNQHFVPDQDFVGAQPASSPRATSLATAGASPIPRAFPGPTAAALAVSTSASTAAAGSPASLVGAPIACTVVASVEAAEDSAVPTAASIADTSAAPGASAPAQTNIGTIADSSTAASLGPASAAAARTVGHGPFTDLPLFCGAQKRAASAFAQQVHTLKQLHQLILLGSPVQCLALY